MTHTVEYKGRRITGDVWQAADGWRASEDEIHCIELPHGRKLETAWLIISWLAKAGSKHRRGIERALEREADEWERRQRMSVNYKEHQDETN